MDVLLKVLDGLWNIRFITGHRTKVAQLCLMLTAAVMAYQGIATSHDLINVGIDLPDLTAQTLLILSALSAYFAKKVAQFSREHQPPTA